MKSTGTFEANKSSGMDIVNFFETVEGTWFSQRTTHFSLGQPSQTGQTMLNITRLSADNPQVIALCEQFAAVPSKTVFALSIQQEGQASIYGSAKVSPQRTTVFVGLKSEEAATGQFLSQTDAEPAVAGQYRLQEEVLLLTTVTDELQSEERLWFMNPNLRMRTTLLKRADGLQMASFCSEIRRISKPTA
ncbi:MAG: phycobiliprotein lyase [Cyanobacteria bacterium J06626_18]